MKVPHIGLGALGLHLSFLRMTGSPRGAHGDHLHTGPCSLPTTNDHSRVAPCVGGVAGASAKGQTTR